MRDVQEKDPKWMKSWLLCECQAVFIFELYIRVFVMKHIEPHWYKDNG